MYIAPLARKMLLLFQKYGLSQTNVIQLHLQDVCLGCNRTYTKSTMQVFPWVRPSVGYKVWMGVKHGCAF
jgi:hypothetical protein